jgi:hypothetical protein
MKHRNLICSLLFVTMQFLPLLSTADSQTVVIQAGADNTLYEDAGGSVSNGSGAIMLTGRINADVDSIRRAVLYFDVAGNLPYGAEVEEVVLKLYLGRGNGGVRDVRVHRLLTDWGEGESEVNGGGTGAQAEPGDTTWVHTFYPDSTWGHKGGRYVGRVSATQLVGDEGLGNDIPGPYAWGSTDRLVDDVRRWLRNPGMNHGWILIGDESVKQTAKRFVSRESVDTAMRPMLEVTYSMPE